MLGTQKAGFLLECFLCYLVLGSWHPMHTDDSIPKTIHLSSEEYSPQLKSARQFFSEIYQKYASLIYFRCQALLRDPQEAADALQDVFVKIMSYWKQYDPKRELLPWVLQITTNHCIDRLRKKRFSAPNHQPNEICQSPHTNPYERRELVISLLGQLDQKTQSIVVYYYLDGFTHSQIANILQVSEKTVLRRLSSFKKYAEKWRKKNMR